MKIGMTGNKHFVKKQDIKNLIWKIKNEIGSDVEIVSLGRKHGADKYVKEFALGFDMKYSEIIPYHDRWNQFCVDGPFMFEKNYSPRYFFISYNNFVKYCDKFIIFDTKQNGDSVVNELKKIITKNDKTYMFLKS